MDVEEWLQGLYASQKKPIMGSKIIYNDIPSYEKNKLTSQVLEDLKDANLSADLQAEEEIRLMKILSQEHQAETNRLTAILSKIKLDVKNLPSELRHLVCIISQAKQQVEELEDTTELPSKIADVSVFQTQALQRLQNLEKVQESLNQMKIADSHEQLAKKKEAEFLSKKIGEYAGHVRHLEKKLEVVEYDPEIRHGALIRRSKELALASEKLSQLRSKLDIYSDLTPDLNLAKIQVQNMKEELAELENQITDNVFNINSN